MYSLIISVRPNCATNVPTIPPGTSEEEARRMCDAHIVDMQNVRTHLALENYHQTIYTQAISEEDLAGSRDTQWKLGTHLHHSPQSLYFLGGTLWSHLCGRPPFNFNSPIEGLFHRIEQCQKFALSGRDPFMLVQLHNVSLQYILHGVDLHCVHVSTR